MSWRAPIGSLIGFVALAGCYTLPETGEDTEGTGGTTTDAGASESIAPSQDDNDPDSTAEGPHGDTSSADGTSDAPTTTGGGPACGNGEIEGDENCDDGVNDGRYGGCLPDCSGVAGYCGDGEVEGPELCDEGNDNANGSGCNVDCVTSGTVVGTYELEDLSFCVGLVRMFPATLAFRANGNALVTASGYCPADSMVLAELDPEVALVESFDDLLLPDRPVQRAALRGTDWLLGTPACTLIVAENGTLLEACDPGRVSGEDGLAVAQDDGYIALDENAIAAYDAASPAVGDEWLWRTDVPSTATYEYDPQDFAPGPGNSMVVVGRRTPVAGGNSIAWLAQYSASGNEVVNRTYASLDRLDRVRAFPDGSGFLAWVSFSGFGSSLVKLDDTFEIVWTEPYADGVLEAAVDSTGDVLALRGDTGNQFNGSYTLSKHDSDLTEERWTLPLPVDTYIPTMVVDAEDYIWIAAVTDLAPGFGFIVLRVSP